MALLAILKKPTTEWRNNTFCEAEWGGGGEEKRVVDLTGKPSNRGKIMADCGMGKNSEV